MREIKFRAWDKSKKRFFQSRDEDISWHIPTIAGISNMIPKYATVTFFDTAQNFIYSQYTGLKDKNGIEIYEGDIVNLEKFDLDLNDNAVDVVRQVSFEDGCFTVMNKPYENGNYTWCNVDMIVLELCKVIGNIYENKELLNER